MSFILKTPAEYQEAYRQSIQHPEAFWENIANAYTWRKPWNNVLSWDFHNPNISWFEGATLNITENCLDRHIEQLGNQPALIWEPNDPKEQSRQFTYSELLEEVNRMANVLLVLGVKTGDRVCIYLPMIPELSFAVLACARIGAIHSVVFAGFSAQSLADRIEDAKAEWVITADGQYRGTKQIPLKAIVDEALESSTGVKAVVVVNRLNWPMHLKPGRDYAFADLIKNVTNFCEPVERSSEDILFILYTSGSTGKPKGVVHTCGGYMIYAGYTFANVFQCDAPGKIFWCTADIGWITGHSYLLYGALLQGATTVMFEGIPTWPDAGRFWQIIDKHRVEIFYTAPTAIRSLMAQGIDPVLPFSLHTLKILGSVGEPINVEAWQWYHAHIGKGKCPIVDTWWQTETGGIMISTIAGVTEAPPATAGHPLPGIQPVLLDAMGTEMTEETGEGNLAIRFPWPGMLRGTYGDPERFRLSYFATYPGYYFTGDGARREPGGLYRILGRVDDVINVSGHRLGTAEIENAINLCSGVIESAVVGFPHEIKGQGIYAFVVLDNSIPEMELIYDQIIEGVASGIGRMAKPDKIQLVTGLPKTRSGKIMRRILRKIAEGEINNLGDISTLLDPNLVGEIIEGRI